MRPITTESEAVTINNRTTVTLDRRSVFMADPFTMTGRSRSAFANPRTATAPVVGGRHRGVFVAFWAHGTPFSFQLPWANLLNAEDHRTPPLLQTHQHEHQALAV